MNISKLRNYKLMMDDTVRMDAYHRAIEATCPGKTVCEIGVGLGPLSLMALRAGATRVYGVELDADVLDAATRVIRASGFGPDRFVPIVGLSTQVVLPEQVDVLLSETLDSMGVGENTSRYMADARERLLKSGGVMLPARLDCYAALSTPEAYQSECSFWTKGMDEYGLSYAPLMEQVRGVKHTIRVTDDDLQSKWQRWQQNDFATQTRCPTLATLALEVLTAGEVHGLAFAFDAELCDGVSIRTFPGDPMTHWLQGFAPFPQGPIEVNAGDLVYVELHFSQQDNPSLNWQLRVASGPAADVAAYMRDRLAQMVAGQA